MKDNKGFSLVELIIVIAIMAVLIGLLAPQYLTFVKKSKVSADISNAQSIATAVNVAFADGQISSGATITSSTTLGAVQVDIPVSKVNSSYTWSVSVGSNGVSGITLNSTAIYPDATAYENANQ